MTKRIVALVAALALATVVVAGCSSGTSTTGGTSSTSGGETTIKIGIGAPITQGATALGKGMVNGAQLAIERPERLG